MTTLLDTDFEEVTTVHPDKQGRIPVSVRSVVKSCGIKADAYKQYVGKHGEILLIPVAEIPLRELWVHRNPEVRVAIERGLAQSAQGQVSDMGDLSHFLDE